jgi:hypothetical protein
MKIKEVKILKNRSEGYGYRAYRKSFKPIIYFSVDKESVLENLENRRSRPHTEYRKLINEALTAAGLPTNTGYKWTWNVKAGCSMCPCSPGFTPYNMSSVPSNELTGNTIYVTITE